MDHEAVVWLVRDSCRLADNPALNRAATLAQKAGATVIPLACLEPRRWADQQYGLPRTGVHWSRFRTESLGELRRDLDALGVGLWISATEPDQALQRLAADGFRVRTVVTDLPIATEERLENAKLESEGYSVMTVESDDLFRAAQLPFELDALPASFTKFRKLIEKAPALVPALPGETAPIDASPQRPWGDPSEWVEAVETLSQPSQSAWTGGRNAGLAHWCAYLEAGALSHYKETRNAFEGRFQSSGLSAWLAHGCLSAREIWHDTLRYEAQFGANESTYWLRFELLWREYFRWYSRASDWTLFRWTGPSDREPHGDRHLTRFRAWCEGSTGCDIVDAAMRELASTGWMSNRARQLVASHCIYESGLDWRLGAAWFEARLIDHDVASNWGNWAYIAGVGADPRGGRIFNLDQQASRYDPEGAYRARWLG